MTDGDYQLQFAIVNEHACHSRFIHTKSYRDDVIIQGWNWWVCNQHRVNENPLMQNQLCHIVNSSTSTVMTEV